MLPEEIAFLKTYQNDVFNQMVLWVSISENVLETVALAQENQDFFYTRNLGRPLLGSSWTKHIRQKLMELIEDWRSTEEG